MYDDFLRMDLPAETSVIGFVEDALACAVENVGILELRINESLWRAKFWLDSRGLKMAPGKTEASLVADRRSFQRSVKIGIEETSRAIEWSKPCGERRQG